MLTTAHSRELNYHEILFFEREDKTKIFYFTLNFVSVLHSKYINYLTENEKVLKVMRIFKLSSWYMMISSWSSDTLCT